MPKRRLLVTGSSGFVGSTLVRVVGEDFSDRLELCDFADPETGGRPDLRDGAAMLRAIGAAKPDVVVHLAAISGPQDAQKHPARAWDVNLHGTFNLAHAIRETAPQCRLVWSGSSEAYGASFNRGSEPILETAPLEPLSAYGATKAACDIMLRQMAETGLDVVIFRPFNHTGPGQTTDFVVPAFAAQIARIEKGLQEPVLQVGNLEALRDFLDVRDVVAAYLKAALAETLVPGARFNLSTGHPISIRSVLERLIALSQATIEVSVDPARYRENPVKVASGSYGRAEEVLGWRPSVDIGETLRGVLADQRARLR